MSMIITIILFASCEDLGITKPDCEKGNYAEITIKNIGAYPIYTLKVKNNIRVLNFGQTTKYRLPWGKVYCYAALTLTTDTNCLTKVGWTKLYRYLPLCGKEDQEWEQVKIK